MSTDHHGNTPAAWTGVLVALLGFVVGSVGLMLDPLNYVLLAIGIVIAFGGLVTFGIMSKAGLN